MPAAKCILTMKFIFTIAIFSILTYVSAQERPKLVPFKSKGRLGLMRISDMVLVYPDSLKDDLNQYDVAGGFQSYIIAKNETEDHVIDAYTGQEQLSGQLDRACGRLRINKDSYYHFEINGNSVLLNPGNPPIHLSTLYDRIEPNHNAWDNESLDGKQYIWALKADETYDVLAVDNNFTPVNTLPKFESFDLVYQINENAPMTLIGFVLGRKTAIQRAFGQKYGIPESSLSVEIYNTNFRRLGIAAYKRDAIAKLFNQEIELRGSMMAPPSLENQLLIPQNKTIVLNNEFSLIPTKEDATKLVLVNTLQGNTPVLGDDHFDYRYISTPQNLKALLQIKHAETGTFFYFDFNGRYFPKGVPLLPKVYREWN